MAFLRDRGVEFDVVEYLKEPPSRAELQRILAALEDEPGDLVRRKDPKFKALGLDRSGYRTRAEVLRLLVEHPELMERPVVMAGGRAVIARPAERALDLL